MWYFIYVARKSTSVPFHSKCSFLYSQTDRHAHQSLYPLLCMCMHGITISSIQLSAACTRTCIPLEEATGISTGKYDLKVRATPASYDEVGQRKFCTKSLILVPLQQTCSVGLWGGMLMDNWLRLWHCPYTLPSLGYSVACHYIFIVTIFKHLCV